MSVHVAHLGLWATEEEKEGNNLWGPELEPPESLEVPAWAKSEGSAGCCKEACGSSGARVGEEEVGNWSSGSPHGAALTKPAPISPYFVPLYGQINARFLPLSSALLCKQPKRTTSSPRRALFGFEAEPAVRERT